MNDFKRLLAYAKPYRRFWPGYLVLSILSVIFGVVNYALIDPLLTVLFQPESMDVNVAKPVFALDPAYFEQMFAYYLTRIKIIFNRLYRRDFKSGIISPCSF